MNRKEESMSDQEKAEKTWINYGFFKHYDEAKNKINDLKDEFESYKIKRVREKSKEGWYKLKVWSKPEEKKSKKSKKNANKKVRN
tara:strand:- start:1047 stop:1301 length:255 start_codon:yes stop_codon:yes gene_type:complete